MLGKISEREAGIQISKYFPWCPFCCFEGLEMDLKPERTHDNVSCSNCGAIWEMQIQEKVRYVKLIAPSVDRKGKELLGKETEPKFWQNKAWLCILTRRTPEKIS
jgi:transcription elongation factor Elf1